MSRTTKTLPPDLGRVLVVMLDHHIGNFVVAAPVIRRLSAYFQGPVDVMVDGRLLGLARLLLGRTSIIAANRRRSIGGVIELARLSRRVTGRFAAVVDVGGGLRSATVALISGARHRVGLDSCRRRWVYNRVIADNDPAHRFEAYAQVLACIGDDQRPPLLTLTLPAELRRSAETRVRAALPHPDRGFAIVHPGAGKSHRIWPAERFAAVADQLVRAHDLDVCLIGGPADDARLAAIENMMIERDSAGRLSLPLTELVAALDQARVLVCNESGPMHLAALTRCPIVAIYGPTSTTQWSPLRRADVALLTGEACSPACRGGRCRAESRCLTGVRVEDVIAAAGAILAAPSAAPVSAEGLEHGAHAPAPVGGPRRARWLTS